MDALKTILGLFSGKNGETTARFFKILSENSFDIKRVLNVLTAEDLLNIIDGFNRFSGEQKTPSENYANGVTTISDIADKEIVYALNKYVSERLY